MISVVICTINPAKFQAVCAQYSRAMGGEPFEIIGVTDAKSMCEGYNRGLAASKGELIIFSHDDIEILAPDFLARLKGHLGRYDGVGVAGTDRLTSAAWATAYAPHTFGQVAHPNPYPNVQGQWIVSLYNAPRRAVGGIQAMDGVFLAFRRVVIEKLGWDAQNFTGFHCYDVDCTFRAYQAGYRLAVACDLGLLHQSGGNFASAQWQASAQVFMKKHAGKLDAMPMRTAQFTVVVVQTREEALEVMTPRYWDRE